MTTTVVLYQSHPFDEHGAVLPSGDRVGVMQDPLFGDWFAFYVLRDGARGSTEASTRDAAARAAADRAAVLMAREGGR